VTEKLGRRERRLSELKMEWYTKIQFTDGYRGRGPLETDVWITPPETNTVYQRRPQTGEFTDGV
jgi:hypothetical protein